MSNHAFCDPKIEQYALKQSTKLPAYLEQLRVETAKLTGQAQMLSHANIGQLLRTIVLSKAAKNCLEIGTFTGFTALCIASALPNGCKLITCEKSPKNAKIAQQYFDQSPWKDKIELKLGEALQTLPAMNERFDLIYLDADKANYPHYYDLLVPKLALYGLLITDNVLWQGKVIHPDDRASQAIHIFNQKAATDPRVLTQLLTVSDGLSILCRIA